MGEQTEHFADEVGELLSRRIKAFAVYLQKEWSIDMTDPQVLLDLELTPEQAEGWNRCCNSAGGAALQWLEEFGY